MNNQPLVSVFMPTYQHEHLISEAIESVLRQTYYNWELVIGDDCSSDDTFGIVSYYQGLYPNKIKAFSNEENLGITSNFNKILENCSGKYIAIMAGDDVLLEHKIEKQVRLMEGSPNAVLSYHDVEVFDSNSNTVIRHWNSGPKSAKPSTGKTRDVAKSLVARGTGFMSALSVMIRREALPEAGFDYRVPIASDWLMWIEVCANSSGVVCYLDETLARYRRHAGSVTHVGTHGVMDEMVTLGIVEARYPWLREAARQRRGYEYYRQGVECVSRGDFSAGRQQLLLGIRTYIWSWKSAAWWLLSWVKQIVGKV
ncbi:glycosyltransferase [Guyparkeria halophila]|uniref:Glycosyltransferase n=1 Tax=Guyparkeria halophila TaxID=47960 RepID=A0A6I6D267_9GAMM|nr:glycosyltransferase [Guyparkeria halophila]QGT78305.1 glycosyltransferase [Guyparkeria halophila]